MLWLLGALLLVGGLALAALRASASADPRFWRGKRVLLVGASSGLGEALAKELCVKGATLILCARRMERLKLVAAECAALYSCSEPDILQLDVTEKQEVLEAKVEEARMMLNGSVDVLCYCAGRGQRTSAISTSAAAHRDLMATNFEGAVTISRILLPSMIDRQKGYICVVSSVQGFFGRSSYAASKAAMIGYFDALRAEVGPLGIAVTVVAPGYIATDHSASAIGSDNIANQRIKIGMAPSILAAHIAEAMQRGRAELVESQFEGHAAIWLRKCWPWAFFKLMERKGLTERIDRVTSTSTST